MIDGPIGQGMFGTVYAARHPLIGAPVAIKVLAERHAKNGAVINRFIQEARAVSRAKHPNIVEVFNFGRLTDGRRYLVMERLEGRGLDAHLTARGRLPADEVIAILRPLASALATAHAAGVIHRDVKPANIFLSADGTPKLLDFGVAKLTDSAAAVTQTTAGIAVGTPAYMAPEQCLGAAVTGAADVYALGTVAFELLTGRLPYQTNSQLEMMNAHVGVPAPAVHRLAAEYAPAVSAAVRAMLHKNPARRPDPVAAVEALARALTRRPRARRPISLAAMVGVVLLSGFIMGGASVPALTAVDADASAVAARHFTPEQKAEILHRHLVDGVEASTLCETYRCSPAVLAQWQTQLFANAPAALQP